MSTSSQFWHGGLAPLDQIQRGQAATEEMYAREDLLFSRERFEEFDTGEQTMAEANIAVMDSKQLEKHIETLESKHRQLIVALRALMRARAAEEAVSGKDEE